MRKMIALLAALAAAAAAPPAWAQTVLTLGAMGEVTVPPDEADAEFIVHATAPDAATAQANENAMMAQALAMVRAIPGVKVTTGGYETSEFNPSNNQPAPPAYAASQSLSLSIPAAGGIPPTRFSALLAVLQKNGLLLNSLDGGLSSAAEAKAEPAAIAAAIIKLQAQAAFIAAQLHESVGAVKSMNVGVRPWQMPYQSGMAFAAADFDANPNLRPPSSAPQVITISANINAEITLKPAP